MNYNEEQTRKARRIARFLIAYPNQGITRDRLASRMRRVRDNYNSSIVTALWPMVERLIDEESEGLLFALRPIGQCRYRCAATTAPVGAMLSSIQREKHILTRMVNDLEKGVNMRRLERDPRFGPDAIRRSIRTETYLMQAREATRLYALDEVALVAEILAMEDIPT